MERLERFYRIDRLLKERPPVPFAELQRALEVSRATLKRDLDYMRDRFNAPIEYDRAARGYRFGVHRTGPRYELPGLWFSADEVRALLTMRQLLVELDPGVLGPQVDALLGRLRAILGSGAHSWQEVESRIRILQPGRRGSGSAHFGVVATALLRRRRLRIRHYHRAEDREDPEHGQGDHHPRDRPRQLSRGRVGQDPRVDQPRKGWSTVLEGCASAGSAGLTPPDQPPNAANGA